MCTTDNLLVSTTISLLDFAIQFSQRKYNTVIAAKIFFTPKYQSDQSIIFSDKFKPMNISKVFVLTRGVDFASSKHTSLKKILGDDKEDIMKSTFVLAFVSSKTKNLWP